MTQERDKLMTYTDMADEIGVSEDAIRRTMKSAMRKVADKLKELKLGRDDLVREDYEIRQ